MWYLCRRPKLLFLYKAYFASYASGLLMLVFWDTRRNDFWAMLLHHAATVILVALSYHLGCGPLSPYEHQICPIQCCEATVHRPLALSRLQLLHCTFHICIGNRHS